MSWLGCRSQGRTWMTSPTEGSAASETPNTLFASTQITMMTRKGTTNSSGNGKITISGSGIVNNPGNAANLAIYGLPSVKTVTYSGSSEFIGTLYSPSAAFTISGGSDAVGAVVINTITLSGGMNFHYDEALGGGTGLLKYVVSSWREL